MPAGVSCRGRRGIFQNVPVTQSSDADRSVEWRADSGRPPSIAGALRSGLMMLGIPPFIAMCVAKFNPSFGWSLPWLGGIAAIGLLCGIYSTQYDRRAVVSLWLEPHAAVPTFTVLRSNDNRASYPIADARRIDVIRTQEEPPKLAMRLRIGGRVEHTDLGLAQPAELLLGTFTASGVEITTRVVAKR